MTDFELGIQSYCFRKFTTIDDLADALEQAGLDYVEIWPKHLPWSTDPADVDAALATFRAKGIAMNAYGNVRFGYDEATARAALSFAQRAGIKALTIDLAPEEFAMAERLSDEYGVLLALHNHGRKHRWGREDQIDGAFARTSPRIGLCLDTAWWLDAGGDPVAAVHKYGSRLYGVHLKDFVFDADGKPEDVIIGTGGLDLPRFVQRLQDVGFDGYLSIEYEGDVDNPRPAVVECVRVIRQAIAGLS